MSGGGRTGWKQWRKSSWRWRSVFSSFAAAASGPVPGKNPLHFYLGSKTSSTIFLCDVIFIHSEEEFTFNQPHLADQGQCLCLATVSHFLIWIWLIRQVSIFHVDVSAVFDQMHQQWVIWNNCHCLACWTRHTCRDLQNISTSIKLAFIQTAVLADWKWWPGCPFGAVYQHAW